MLGLSKCTDATGLYMPNKNRRVQIDKVVSVIHNVFLSPLILIGLFCSPSIGFGTDIKDVTIKFVLTLKNAGCGLEIHQLFISSSLAF
jgi:hypothetical protein